MSDIIKKMLESFIAHAQITGHNGPGSGIKSPLSDSITDIPKLINAILGIIIQIGFPLVVVMIVYCGFLFVMARGNKDQLETAKKAIVWTLIGAAVLLGASVISAAIQSTITNLK